MPDPRQVSAKRTQSSDNKSFFFFCSSLVSSFSLFILYTFFICVVVFIRHVEHSLLCQSDSESNHRKEGRGNRWLACYYESLSVEKNIMFIFTNFKWYNFFFFLLLLLLLLSSFSTFHTILILVIYNARYIVLLIAKIYHTY